MDGLKKELIEKLLCRGKVFEIGGSVRDSLLGMAVAAADRDYLVTGIPIDDLVSVLRQHGKVDLVGRAFGVIKFSHHDNGSGPYPQNDISLPRREFSTGSGHRDFHIDFDHTLPIEEDLQRRDFTINAIARDLSNGRIVDPLGGSGDVANRVLRVIGHDSFRDDPLRDLRGVQFVARFGLSVDPATLAAMTECAPMIRTVTAERIGLELTKLLTKSAKPSVGLRLMHEIGLMKEVMPELDQGAGVTQPGGYHAYDVLEHSLHTVDAIRPDLRMRWAALLHDITKPKCRNEVEGGVTFYGHEKSGAKTAKNILIRLRYPNQLIDDVTTLIDQHMFAIPPTDKGMRRLVRRASTELIFDLLDLRRADVVGQGMGNKTDDVDEFERRIREELNRKPPFSVNDLEIDGNDIMELFQIPESPLIGMALDHLLELVLDDPERNRRDILIEATKEFLNSEESK
jgi:putative nucleotidyltransferase with HDIG domain